LRQGELQVQQDVFAGLARLTQAENVVNDFRTTALPKLRQTLEELDKLYRAGQPGVDLARIIDIRRRLLRARDSYLDVLFEMSQAQVDLAAAVSDLSFAGCLAKMQTPEAPPANQRPTEPAGEQLPAPAPVPEKK
jgi:outer membrane protein TolC